MKTLITIFKIPELAQKIGITLLFLAIYRIGYHITLPIIDQSKIGGDFGGGLGQIFSLATTFSGSNIGQRTIFGLGIMPYISASILFQLLANFYPPLEKLQKEGESGRKKINEYTRYATVPICLFQSFMWVQYLMRDEASGGAGLFVPGYEGAFYVLSAVITMTAGTMFLMWLGEQIDEYGIGNGISLIIMAGILARLPNATQTLLFDTTTGNLKESIYTLGGGGGQDVRSEERRVGKECRCGWWAYP